MADPIAAYGSDSEDTDLIDWLRENGYPMGKRTPVGVAAVAPMTFGKGRIVVGSKWSVDDAYCYNTMIEAILALVEWDPETEREPDGWFRSPTDGRRRPDGDKTKEYHNP